MGLCLFLILEYPGIPLPEMKPYRHQTPFVVNMFDFAGMSANINWNNITARGLDHMKVQDVKYDPVASTVHNEIIF